MGFPRKEYWSRLPFSSPGHLSGPGLSLCFLHCRQILYHWATILLAVIQFSSVAQSCPTLCDPMDRSLPGSSVHGFSRQEYWSGLPLPSPYKCQASVRINSYTQFSSVTESCTTLCDLMDCRMPGFPVHHQLLEFTQTHVYWVSDAIQPSHPLLSRSPLAFNLSQHQGLFKRVSSSHQVAKILEFQLQHQSFQWTPRTDLL